MYNWQKMTDSERKDAVATRKARGLPWHSPPHLDLAGERRYIITAACYKHAAVIGQAPDRMANFEDALIKLCRDFCSATHAWCLLPNHYHLLVTCSAIAALREALGQLHGRTSYDWNGEENTRGRKVWHNCFERPMKSERHFWASLNYVHNNAVHHGYVQRWQDWPYASGANFILQVGRARAAEIWQAYPILKYGSKWDNF